MKIVYKIIVIGFFLLGIIYNFLEKIFNNKKYENIA